MAFAYLHSSIAHLEQIESLFERLEYSQHLVGDRHCALAERSKVPLPPPDSYVSDWLRRLPPSDANRLIDELEKGLIPRAVARTHHDKGTP